uniref:Uncharacterized protein n=1 Tax=Knipowitschia caucasica TaxID=637954 RepID=A0AAV2JY91_KNICA
MVVRKTRNRHCTVSGGRETGGQRQADNGRETEVACPVWKLQGARSNAWPRVAAATGRRAAASPQERSRGEPRWRHSDHGAQPQTCDVEEEPRPCRTNNVRGVSNKVTKSNPLQLEVRLVSSFFFY